jgi:RNA polymerase primary sigma factor
MYMAVVTKKGGRRKGPKPAQIAREWDDGQESLDLYLKDISKIPLLKIDEEKALGRKAFKGDKRAQEELARRNVRFVVSVAKQYQNRGVPLMDLIGEGNLGLLTAARKFDPERGVKFISYAVWWVRQAIQAAIARHGRAVRLPLNRTADANRLARATTALKERLGRHPTLEELVVATRLTVETVQSLAALAFEPLRLDRPVREGDSTERMERFMALTEEGTDSIALENNRTEELYAALDQLPARDAKVIRLYFGLDDDEPRTLEQIGRLLGVTRERVRQLRDRALKTLREQHGDALRELAA